MSDHSNNPADSAKSNNPLKVAIAVVVGVLALIIGIILLTRFAVGTHEMGTNVVAANTPEAINKRIAPATMLLVDTSKGAAPGATPAVISAPAANSPAVTAAPIMAMAIPAALPAGSAAPAGGEGVYKGGCVACHGAGIAGAPKVGDQTAWAPRIAQGKPVLYEHAIKGYQGKAGVMPAKGGNVSLADADVKAAVDYMVSLNK